MLVTCAVLVQPIMIFTIQLHVEESILLVTLVHFITKVSKETFVEASKVVDKPTKVKIDICLCTRLYYY